MEWIPGGLVIARVGGAAVTVQELNVMYGLSIQLDVRRYPADASLEPSLPFVDWMARLRKATARPSATLLANHLRWQNTSATGH
jgi:hypothetical protein